MRRLSWAGWAVFALGGIAGFVASACIGPMVSGLGADEVVFESGGHHYATPRCPKTASRPVRRISESAHQATMLWKGVGLMLAAGGSVVGFSMIGVSACARVSMAAKEHRRRRF